MMIFYHQLQEGIGEELPTSVFKPMGPRTLVGDMVDNHVKEKGLPPLKDELLDVLGLGDIVFEGLFG
jgi:hypothetical protein